MSFFVTVIGIVLAVGTAQAAETVEIRVDWQSDRGPVKPVNAVGQPPMIGGPRNFWMMHYLKDAGIPYSRLHDVGGLLGGGVYVDIPNLFPDFEADEEDEKSYAFDMTDALLKALVDNGVEPYFRLGVTIENFAGQGFAPRRIQPPKDFAKWARICEHVIRHYTEGWANGKNNKVTYWEIWNEPENFPEIEKNCLWKGDFDLYMDFYGTVAPYLKAKFPRLKIGGYGSCGFYSGVGAGHVNAAHSSPRMDYFVTCAERFLAAAKANGWPLDFFSFHSYSDVSEAMRQVAFADKLLNSYGFTTDRTERHFNEWLPYVRHENLGTDVQAAGIAAELIGLQNGPCQLACLYDARCGVGNYSPLFNPMTFKPHKAYFAFTAFNELRKSGRAVYTESSETNVWVAAASGKGRRALLLANDSDRSFSIKTNFEGMRPSMCHITDKHRTDAALIDVPELLPPHSFVVAVFSGCESDRDALIGPQLGNVTVGGHVAEMQKRFFDHRIFSDFAKTSIWAEAHSVFQNRDDDVYNKGVGMWRGEFWGKLMISACRVAEYSKDSTLKDFLHREALSLVSLQLSDGYLGSYADAENVLPLSPEEGIRRLGWPCTYNWNIWCRKYTMWGLLACYRMTGDRVLLAAVDKSMTQLLEMLRRRNIRLCDTGTAAMRGLPPCSLLKPLLLLYRETQNANYLDWAKEIVGYFSNPSTVTPQFAAKLATARPIQDWYPEENGYWGKAYEMMSTLDGFVEYYRVTGDRSALEVVIKMQERILSDEQNLCLSVGYNDQFWGAGRHLNGVSEPCDAIHWMRLNHDLWHVTGEAKYIDAFELTFYNAFLAAMQPDGAWGARVVRSHTRHQKAPPQCGLVHQHCCINNLPRGFMDAAESVVAKGRDGALYVALYHDAMARIEDDVVTLSGGYPVCGEVTLQLKKRKSGPVRLRVPAWCPELTICADGFSRKVTKAGWVELMAPVGTSEWKLSFDLAPRVVESKWNSADVEDIPNERMRRWADQRSESDLIPLFRSVPSARLMSGPLLLAKSVKFGDSCDVLLNSQTVNLEGWNVLLEPQPRKDGFWGVWKAVFRKGDATRSFSVCDYPSAATWAGGFEFSLLF